MATIFPNRPDDSSSREVVRTFRFFDSLPDTFRVWQKMSSERSNEPDFLVIDPDHRALVVRVNTQHKPLGATQLLLLSEATGPGIDCSADRQILSTYLAELHAKFKNLPVPTGIILFPNYTNAELAENGVVNANDPPFYAGNDYLKQENRALWVSCFENSPALKESDVQLVRGIFCPEIVIPDELTTMTKPNELPYEEFLLDYEQERITKLDLKLPKEQREILRSFDIKVLNGVAGSGKTLILIYRLKLLHTLDPKERFLVLTHNKALILDIQQRYFKLTGTQPDNVTFSTFLRLCWYLWPDAERWIHPMGKERKETIIRRIWKRHFAKSSVTERMFAAEIDWFKDRWFDTEQDYLNADRRGTGFAISNRQRMLAAINEYQNHLKQMNLMDWADIPRWIMEFIQTDRIRPWTYDHIFVDEGQFFAPLWFEIIRKILKPQGGRIFIAADPKQGFLGRGSSWRSVGFEVRNHTYFLARSYRTTEEILRFSTSFYEERIPEDNTEDEIVQPELDNMPRGLEPILLQVDRPQNEVYRVVDEIDELHRRGIPLGDFLVLTYTWHNVQTLIDLLRQRFGAHSADDPKDRPHEDFVRVTTLHAGTGIESPIVILFGLRQLFDEEQNLRLSASERAEIVRENTQKLYMAFTRAGQRIIIVYAGPLPESLSRLLE